MSLINLNRKDFLISQIRHVRPILSNLKSNSHFFVSNSPTKSQKNPSKDT